MVDSDDDPDYGLAVNYSVRTHIGEGQRWFKSLCLWPANQADKLTKAKMSCGINDTTNIVTNDEYDLRKIVDKLGIINSFFSNCALR